MEIISELVAYRFVLTDKPSSIEAVTAFNAALSRVPIEFMDSKKCIDLYRDFGNKFTSQKYYEFILALLEETLPGQQAIDKHVLENVPSASYSYLQATLLPSVDRHGAS